MRHFRIQRHVLSLALVVCLGCSGTPGSPSLDVNPGGNPGPSNPPPPPPPGGNPPPTTSVGPLTGAWSGSMQVTTPAGQPPITVSATLNHTIRNGQSTVTGALTVTNTDCLTPATLPLQAATFQDPDFALDVAGLHLSGHIVDANTLAAQFEIRSGTCNGMAGTGTLTRQPSTAAVAGIQFTFELVQGGSYGGPIWLAIPTFTVVGCVVKTRAHNVNAAGVVTDLSPVWTPENSGLVTVSPSQGHEVTITALAAGSSDVRVSAAGFPSKLLHVEAKPHLTTLICTFSQ